MQLLVGRKQLFQEFRNIPRSEVELEHFIPQIQQAIQIVFDNGGYVMFRENAKNYKSIENKENNNDIQILET